ncbi:GIP [Symbiodinium sp. CCMP2456]|nr:GIP [Symbiodinium sp. CCMP2456]
MPAISQMSKKELGIEIEKLGGVANLERRKMELQVQLLSLREEQGISSSTKATQTDYQRLTVAMNRAGSKKADVMAFMEKELHLHPRSNDTLVQLQKAALLKIYDMAAIHETDPVGFGHYSTLSYAEVLTAHPDYVKWVRATAAEGQCNPLMTRLATWIERTESSTTTSATTALSKEKATRPKAKSTSAPSAVSEYPASSSSMDSQMMQQLVGENHPDEEMIPEVSDGSFVVPSMKNETITSETNEAWSIVPELFQSLSGHERLALLEVRDDGETIYGRKLPLAGQWVQFNPKAHWQIGTCEQAIQGIKEALHKLAQEEPEAVFLPSNTPFGRAADTTGRLINEAHGMPDELQVENADGEFERNVQRQSAAEKAFSEWQAHQRLLRAAHSRAQPVRDYLPGELVYFWRTQESGKHKVAPGTHKGRFLGPARILATETKRDQHGQLRPGSAIWLVRGRQLIKCAPEHLRHASPREELVESLTSGDQKVPWTFHRVAQEIGGNQFEDLSQQATPTEGEWRRAQDPTQEVQPVRYRVSQKRPPPTVDEAPRVDQDEVMTEAGTESLPQRPRLSEPASQAFATGACWWTDVATENWRTGRAAYWNDATAAVEVGVDLPESSRGKLRMINNFEGFFAGALKKRRSKTFLPQKPSKPFQLIFNRRKNKLSA